VINLQVAPGITPDKIHLFTFYRKLGGSHGIRRDGGWCSNNGARRGLYAPVAEVVEVGIHGQCSVMNARREKGREGRVLERQKDKQ
jgi:hypothetical protein